jgi:hypothetical protein
LTNTAELPLGLAETTGVGESSKEGVAGMPLPAGTDGVDEGDGLGVGVPACAEAVGERFDAGPTLFEEPASKTSAAAPTVMSTKAATASPAARRRRGSIDSQLRVSFGPGAV